MHLEEVTPLGRDQRLATEVVERVVGLGVLAHWVMLVREEKALELEIIELRRRERRWVPRCATMAW